MKAVQRYNVDPLDALTTDLFVLEDQARAEDMLLKELREGCKRAAVGIELRRNLHTPKENKDR